MSNLQHKLEELLNYPQFAVTEPRYEVCIYDPLGNQVGCVDCRGSQEAADNLAREITRDIPELAAQVSGSDSCFTTVYHEGRADSAFVSA